MLIANSEFVINEEKIEEIKINGFEYFHHQLLSYTPKIEQIRIYLKNLALCSKEFIRDLMEALKGTQIIVLYLRIGSINRDNIEQVIELIQVQNTSITKLDLRNNDVQEYAPLLIQALRNTDVTSLDLSNNNINDQHILALEEALQDTKLKTLYLNNNKITKQAHLLAAQMRNTSITTLSLGNDFDPAKRAANSFGKSAPLFAQALRGSQIMHLHLKKINIDKNTLFAFGQALQGTKVALLDLSVNNMGEHAPLLVQALRGSQVATLDLSYNCISEHILLLAQALQGTQVTTLILANNGFGEQDSALIMTFAQALRSTKVTTLHFGWNDSSNNAIALVQGLKGTPVTTLDLTGGFIDDENMLEMIPSLCMTNIHTLILNNNALEGRAWITKLSTKLHALSLGGNYLQGLAAIAVELAYTSVKRMDVRDFVVVKDHDFVYKCLDRNAKASPGEHLIQRVTLVNCRRDYIQRLGLAEYHASVLKELYQKVFPFNTRLFPPKIACLIARFLGHAQDQNLLKRFLNVLKMNSNTSLTALSSNELVTNSALATTVSTLSLSS